MSRVVGFIHGVKPRGIRLVPLVNSAAAELLDCPAEGAIGRSLESVVDATLLLGSQTGAATLQTGDGLRRLDVTASEIGSDGRTPVVRDVTERQTQRQRLEVLNRVLRHNLRNGVDAILANARVIDDEERGAAIRRIASNLERLGNKARDAQRLLDAERLSFERCALPELFRGVVADARENHPDAEVRVITRSLTVWTDPVVLSRVVTELVDNGIQHADDPTPRVEITTERVGDRVEIAVADEGSGIPENERRAVTAGTGTALKHATGVGLWLVEWSVTYVGGSVSSETSETGGSVVTVSVPTADEKSTE